MGSSSTGRKQRRTISPTLTESPATTFCKVLESQLRRYDMPCSVVSPRKNLFIDTHPTNGVFGRY